MEISESNELKCYCCKATYNESDKFCGKCGYPLKATPEEQKKFSINYTLNRFEKDIVKGRLQEVRIILYVISAFTLIYGFVYFIESKSIVLLIVYILFAIMYFLFAVWAKKNAFAASLTGGIVYVSTIVFMAFIYPLSIFSGIIFKVIFIIAFIRATYGSYKYKVNSAEL